MRTRRFLSPRALQCLAGAAAVLAAGAGLVVVAGPLNPPAGAVASTYKTLAEVEPRTNLATVAGSAAARHVIGASGSYYLSANVTGAAGLSGIIVTADHVTIDLNGFTVAGVAGSGTGIQLSGARTNVVIKNGVVRGWGGAGIDAADDANVQVSSVVMSGNTAQGVVTGPGALIVNCLSLSNGGHGYELGEGSCVQSSTARSNTGDGMFTNPFGGSTNAGGSTITGCTSTNNGGGGFRIANSAISGSTAAYNGGAGFQATNSTITGCWSRANATHGFITGNTTVVNSTTRSNTMDGFNAGEGSLIQACVSRGNTGDGIECDKEVTVLGCHVEDNFSGIGIRVVLNDCRLEGNTLLNNGTNGILIGAGATGNTVYRNAASGHATNYSIVGGNDVGPIGTAAAATSPWANIQY